MLKVCRLLLPLLALVGLVAAPAVAQTTGTESTDPEVATDEIFTDSVDVRLIALQAQAYDQRGEPLRGLQASDFRVSINGKRIPVEAVEWIEPPDGGPVALLDRDGKRIGDGSQQSAALPTHPMDRNLLVLFVQNDFDVSRLIGFRRTLPLVEDMLRRLPADHQVALLSFDTRLNLRLDFSTDRDLLASLLHDSIRRDEPPFPAAGDDPSLARFIEAKDAADAATAIRALELLGNALQQIPGNKAILFLGYGLGTRYRSTSAPHYQEALESLQLAKTPVLALNVTDAGSNSLSGGLVNMAVRTGGFYQSTAIWPKMAVRDVERTFGGHYLLFIPWQDLTAGQHSLAIRLHGIKGRVRAHATAVEATAEEVSAEGISP